MVLGILGIVLSPILIGLLLAVPAVVCGHLATGGSVVPAVHSPATGRRWAD